MSPENVTGNGQAAFTMLADGKPRWRSFSAGFGIELLLLLCALWIPGLFPQQMVTAKQYLMTEITAPPLRAWKPRPKIVPRRVAMRKPAIAKTMIPDPPKRKLIEPVFEKPVVARAIRRNRVVAPKIREWAKAVPNLSVGNSAMPELKRPRAPVQTGGFGDPDSLPSAPKVTHAVNMASAGAFDMPTGPGKGNGRGGAKGVEGTVASAGFGNGRAIAARRRRHGHVREGQFGAEQLSSTPHVQKTAARAPETEPVVILYKPTPQYTEEAKRLKIQGYVLVQVIFKRSGQVQVLRVIRGLGHGMDASAEEAAREIRFQAARRDGRPVDFPATVRIQFELAY